jgi:hypothetical protein
MSLKPIGPASSFRQIHLPTVNALVVNWAPQHAMLIPFRILSTPSHPLYTQVKRRYMNRTDPLWWSCVVSNRVGGNKKVIRGWLANRARAAFKKALKKEGYAENGARLVKNSEESAKGDLFGSIQITIQSQLLHISWTDLCNQADLIVAAIEGKQGQSQSPNRKERRLKAIEGASTIKSSQVKSRQVST